MNKYSLKNLIREAILNKEDNDIINAAISYLVKHNEFNVSPGVILIAKAILCDKRKGNSRNYSQMGEDVLELCKFVIDKVTEIKGVDPQLFRTMVLDGTNRKYRKLWDEGNKVIIIGD